MTNITTNTKHLHNLLVVSGSGRNVGKTGMVCKIIAKLAGNHKVVAIKISNNYHHGDPYHGSHPLMSSHILEETNRHGSKDSMRFLQAGAYSSWFLQIDDENIMETFNNLLKKIDNNSLLVCESNALPLFVKAGLSVMIIAPEMATAKPVTYTLLAKADAVFKALNTKDFDAFVSTLQWNGQCFTT